MRIAHVVTYVSADGAFGGPVAVALGQTAELARRGHQVDLLAGWDGEADLPASGATHRLFPVRRIGPGFAGLTAPGLLAWLRAHGREYDAVHVHLARDLITLSAARMALAQRTRVVVQPHGMVMPDPRLKARVVDAMATRNVLHRAAAVLALTDGDRDGLGAVARRRLSTLNTIPNGVPRQNRPPVQERCETPVVTFLARLHPRKRVLAFAEAARILVEEGQRVAFEIFGPDEGDLQALTTYIAQHDLGQHVHYRGPVPMGGACDQLRRAAVYVLPAVREVFPMTVLEAMSVGTPVVLGRDCGIAGELERRGAAAISDGTPMDLARQICRLLPGSADRTLCIVEAARALDEWCSIEAVVRQLEQAYVAGRVPGSE